MLTIWENTTKIFITASYRNPLDINLGMSAQQQDGYVYVSLCTNIFSVSALITMSDITFKSTSSSLIYFTTKVLLEYLHGL